MIDVNEIHQVNLYLLKIVDDLCKKFNIKYRLDSGTLLGAIRHKGFIPWDDDVDIVMQRDEYERFVVAIKNIKNDYIKFISFDEYDDKHYFDFVNRLFYVKKKVRVGKEYETRYNGIFQYCFLDIFILDKIPKYKLLQNVVLLKQKIICGLALAYRYEIKLNKYRNLIQKIQVVIFKLVGKLFSLKTIYKMQKCLSTKYNDKNYDDLYYSNYEVYWLDRKYFTNVNVEQYVYVDFENINLPVSINSDYILKKLYGNYMTLPKEEDRVLSHKDILLY